LKIFPDLIDSQEIQKIFSSVSSGNFFKITFLEFESFLKSVAMKIFANTGDFSDSFEMFLAHIRSFALKTYGIEVKMIMGKRRSLSKHLKSSKQLSVNSIKNKSAVKIPETTRNIGKKMFFDLVNPGINKFKKKKLRKMKENLSFGPVEGRVKKMIREIKDQDFGQKWIRTRKVKSCARVFKVAEERKVLIRIFFLLWRVLTKE
jgi:hypothetical protein